MSPRTANAPIRLGVAGLGQMGTFHLERISMRDDCTSVAAFDFDCANADYARSFGSHIHRSWASFLEDDNIEVVLISTPPDRHCELAIEALRAGKHVVVDKPLCISTVQADSMIDAAADADRMLSVFHSRRWDEGFVAAANVLESGEIGQLQAVKLINWEFGITDRQSASNWKNDPSRGGGVLFEFGSHYFDQLLQLVDSRVERVFAQVTGESTKQRDSENAFLAIISFCNGVEAHVEVNRRSPTPFHSCWVLTGTKGGFHDGQQFHLESDGEIYSSPVEVPQSGVDGYYGALVAHLRTDSEIPIPAVEARRVIELIEAVQESAAASQVVTLP